MVKVIGKGFAMLALLVALAHLSAASANAQSNRVRADIPFDFIVANEKLAAGSYVISPITGTGDVLSIRNMKGKGANRLTSELHNGRSSQVKLVFHRYGQNYFLAEVWDGDTSGRRLNKCRQERAIERELASIPSKSEQALASYETVVVTGKLF